MTHAQITKLSLPALRDRLRARADDRNSADDLDPIEVMSYLMSLPMSSHTADSADALRHLCRNFAIAAQPAEELHSALFMSEVASSLDDRLLLGRSHSRIGWGLHKLGRFSEATVAQANAWTIARELNDRDLELAAVWGLSTISVGMGQWHAAIRYCERMRALAEEMGQTRNEFIARNNLADCALQLRNPVVALQTLGKLAADAPRSDINAGTHVHLHINLGRSCLLIGDVATAKLHAEKAADWATAWGVTYLVHRVEALQGIVDVRLGRRVEGLAAVNRALEFAKRANQAEVPDNLGMCIDAYEAAGDLERALAYLDELVEWKKKSVDAEVAAWRFPGLTEALQLQIGAPLFDDGLVAKVHALRTGVQNRVERLLETALNAGIAGGDDLYRPFRVANLARYVAVSLGWDHQRISPLVLGAQLFKIGMIAIPVRILVKAGRLAEGESNILRGHAEYGGQLLRKSKLQILDIAAVVAEQRHEHYDGSGYPRGLSNEAITEEARIVAICDAFDAMTHKRASRHAPLPVEVALGTLAQDAGGKFDPRLVGTFVDFVRLELPKHADFDAFLAEGADQLEYVRVRARMDAMLANGDEA